MRRFFFAGNGKPGAGLDGLVVGGYHALPAAYIAYARHGAAGGTAALFFIHIVTGQCADFDEGAVFVEQVIQAFAGGELVFFVLFLDGFFSAAQRHGIKALPVLAQQ